MRTRGIILLGVTALTVASCSLVGDQTVPAEDLEQGVADLLEEQIGEPVAAVDCEDDLKAEVGTEVRCTLEAEDGSTIGLTVTADSIDGDTVNYTVQVDDAASTGPTGSSSPQPSPSAT